MSQPLQLFPALPKATEDALRAAIQRFGVLVPVVTDQCGRVLDGHHRVKLATELGIEYPVTVRPVASEEEAQAIAYTLNADRRQLTPEERREIAVALRQEGHSYPAIAGALGVHHTTVMRDVAKAQTEPTCADAQVEPPARILGLDGKSRPATLRIIPLPKLAPAERAILSKASHLLAEGKTFAEVEQQLAPPREAPLPTTAQARKLARASEEAGEPRAYLDNTGHWRTGMTDEEAAARSAVYSQSRALLNGLEAFGAPALTPEALLEETPVWWEHDLLPVMDDIIRYITAYAQLLHGRQASRQEGRR